MRMLKRMSAFIESGEYMRTNNTLQLLNVCMPVFPPIKEFRSAIRNTIEKRHDVEEKQDLKNLLKATSNRLNATQDKCIFSTMNDVNTITGEATLPKRQRQHGSKEPSSKRPRT